MPSDDRADQPTAALDKPASLSRRGFLIKVSGLVGALAAALVAIPIVGVVVSPLVEKPKEIWRTVGRLDDFPLGQTVKVSFVDASPLPWSGVTAKTAAWLRRDGQQSFTAFSINCTHLGCPVRWISGAQLFMCPCHGGVYNQDGSVAAGPPPKPLAKYPTRVRDGQVEIQTSGIPISS
jgi:menaquinol-cytochrome c reductase iron-sulfur subunit